MRSYLGPLWTNSCKIWCVRVFRHVLLKYHHEKAEMQKWKFDITLQYSILRVRFHLMRTLTYQFWPSDFQVEAQVYDDDVTAEHQRHECGVYTALTSGWWIIGVTSSIYACACISQSKSQSYPGAHAEIWLHRPLNSWATTQHYMGSC